MSKKRLSLGKKVVFMTFTTIVFFGAIEGLLALLGVGTAAQRSDPLVGFASHAPLLESSTDAAGAKQLRTAGNKLVWFNQVAFPQQKPQSTRRVFCVGGSTTFGRPYSNTTSFSGWLQELLPDVDDSTSWEVINAGGVSYASYRVTRVMEELAQYQPDLFVVYTGQNEFLERRTYANLFDQPSIQLSATSLLSRTRTWSLLQETLQSARDVQFDDVPASDVLSGEVNERLNHTVGPVDYHRDDQWRADVLQHFAANLRQMTRIAHASGAEIAFVVPASNEKDCSPFKSESDEFGKRDALTSFQRGQTLLDAGDVTQAHRMFRDAIDEDICPLRAPSDFVETVRTIAKNDNTILVDFDHRLRQLCLAEHGHTILGDEYFLDHVHPTIDAHQHLAVWIIEELQRHQRIRGQSLTDDAIANARQRVLSKIDLATQAVALRNLAKVLHWAGKFEEAAPRALDALRVTPGDAESLLVLADCLWQTGQADEAIRRYEQLSRTSPAYARAYQPYGEVLLDLGNYTDARNYLSLATLAQPTGSQQHVRSTYLLAIAHLKLCEFEQAVSLLEQTRELYPSDRDTLFYLAQSKAGLNESEQALSLYEEVLQDHPDDIETLNCMGLLLLQNNQPQESVKYLETAVGLAPGDEKSLANLQIARQLLK